MDQRPIRPVQHQYGTRIRQNSTIKPSARLRQSPDPPTRKLTRPITLSREIQFPPPNVMLHPEDANSKVFLAIGRSFLSVNNCAMTIKDLAEMTLKFGLICQNVSAAGQAITTYIRTHMQRCEVQQDHPLLLRHILSGTPDDDDLLPALYSRSGGAHCTLNSETRATNFRRGTMVWYLSKATGSPCPFARAGIRLCEYGESGRVAPDGGRHQQDNRICGQKRKRLLRGCADKSSDSGSDSDHGNRPPKVKLMLRLRPCMTSFSGTARRPKQVIDLSRDSDCADEYMSVDSSDDSDDASGHQEQEEPWSLPPYPRRSISIPPYTPSCDDTYPSIPGPSSSHTPEVSGSYRRSPSVPFSVASPPPDSEDDDDNYRIAMTDARRYSAERLRTPAKPEPDTDLDFDPDSDLEGESETLWESPGPRSPSAPLVSGPSSAVIVKQEPWDVQGMLDAWEDFDCSIADAKVVEMVAAATSVDTESTSKVKVEPLDLWDWEGVYKTESPEWFSPALEYDDTMHVKQEEFDLDSTLMSPDDVTSDDSSPLSYTSSRFSNFSNPQFHNFMTPRRHSELAWQDAELLGPDSIHPQEFEERQWEEGVKNFATFRRARTSTSLPSLVIKPPLSSPSMRRELPSSSSTATIRGRSLESSQPSTPSLASLVQALSIGFPAQSDSVSPSSLMVPPAQHDRPTKPVVVHTCHPCTPAVSATQVEGISVYQMILDSSPLLRRIDTDFVNLSPIANYLGIASPPVISIPNAMVIAQGSASVLGTWVPLASAQTFVREHALPDNFLDIFLSDVLFERFPSALQDFHRSNAPGRLLNQFGLHFNSTLEAQQSQLSHPTGMPFSTGVSWDREPVSNWDVEDHLLAIYPPSLPERAMQTPLEDAATVETPLSATEQEMFHALCVIPDWEKENSVPATITPSPPLKSVTIDDESVVEDRSPPVADRPLRRSKRVANAIAVRSRTSGRRSTRNSLS